MNSLEKIIKFVKYDNSSNNKYIIDEVQKIKNIPIINNKQYKFIHYYRSLESDIIGQMGYVFYFKEIISKYFLLKI